jgi:hypothetical protein
LAAIVASAAPLWRGELAGSWRLMPAIGAVLAIVIPAALLAVTATGRGTYRLARWPGLAPAAAVIAAGTVAAGDALMLVMFGTWAATATTVVWPVAGWAAVVSLTRLVAATAAAHHCAALARPTGPFPSPGT